jgi:hypothetical protein
VIERLDDLTDGKGPEKCIDAIGMESHVSPGQPDTLLDRARQMRCSRATARTCCAR